MRLGSLELSRAARRAGVAGMIFIRCDWRGRMGGAIGFGGQAEKKTGDDEDEDSLFFRGQHEARHEPILSLDVLK